MGERWVERVIRTGSIDPVPVTPLTQSLRDRVLKRAKGYGDI